MAKDALERLYDSNSQEESSYSLEEQMESAENNEDFLDGMSSEAEDALFKSVTEVTMDEEPSVTVDEPEVTVDEPEMVDLTDDEEEDLIACDPSILDDIREAEEGMKPQEELFNNNNVQQTESTAVETVIEPKRGRRKSNKSNVDTESNAILSNNAYDPIMDQIAKDVIDDLRKSNYKISRFDDATMKIVFDYMYRKF